MVLGPQGRAYVAASKFSHQAAVTFLEGLTIPLIPCLINVMQDIRDDIALEVHEEILAEVRELLRREEYSRRYMSRVNFFFQVAKKGLLS